MNKRQRQFLQQWEELGLKWRTDGLPSREAMFKMANTMDHQMKTLGIQGLWQSPPKMVTATLDDAIGQGLDIIERFAQSMGISVERLGLLQLPDAIVAACQRILPQFLGLTVLQIDSDAALAAVGHHLPTETRLIAGGPAFKFDPYMAERCGVHFMAANVTGFIDYMLKDAKSEYR